MFIVQATGVFRAAKFLIKSEGFEETFKVLTKPILKHWASLKNCAQTLQLILLSDEEKNVL
jgi:hypothetical protein